MNVLVLATNRTLTLSLLRCLRPLGHRVFVVADGSYPVVQWSNTCQSFASFDHGRLSSDPQGLLSDLNDYCRRNEISVLVPCGIDSVLWLAEHRDAISACRVFPGMDLETTRRVHNKWRFALFLAEQGLPFPTSRLLQVQSETESFDLPFPVIAKPLERDASQGVTRIDTALQLAAHTAEAAAQHDLPLLVQDFIPGDDLSLSVFAEHGVMRAYTLQRIDPQANSLEFLHHEEAADIARRLAAAIPLHGLANFDLRLDSRDGLFRIIECNPRFYASVHIAMLCGVNFADLGIRHALGQRLSDTASCQTRFVQPERLLPKLLRGQLTARDLSGPTRRGLRLEIADPLATAMRLVEKRNLPLSQRIARLRCPVSAAFRPPASSLEGASTTLMIGSHR